MSVFTKNIPFFLSNTVELGFTKSLISSFNYKRNLVIDSLKKCTSAGDSTLPYIDLVSTLLKQGWVHAWYQTQADGATLMCSVTRGGRVRPHAEGGWCAQVEGCPLNYLYKNKGQI